MSFGSILKEAVKPGKVPRRPRVPESVHAYRADVPLMKTRSTFSGIREEAPKGIWPDTFSGPPGPGQVSGKAIEKRHWRTRMERDKHKSWAKNKNTQITALKDWEKKYGDKNIPAEKPAFKPKTYEYKPILASDDLHKRLTGIGASGLMKDVSDPVKKDMYDAQIRYKDSVYDYNKSKKDFEKYQDKVIPSHSAMGMYPKGSYSSPILAKKQIMKDNALWSFNKIYQDAIKYPQGDKPQGIFDYTPKGVVND